MEKERRGSKAGGMEGRSLGGGVGDCQIHSGYGTLRNRMIVEGIDVSVLTHPYTHTSGADGSRKRRLES